MTAPRRQFPPATFQAPIADAAEEKLNTVPTVTAINFQATDGSVWRLRISPTGAILLDPVP